MGGAPPRPALSLLTVALQSSPRKRASWMKPSPSMMQRPLFVRNAAIARGARLATSREDIVEEIVRQHFLEGSSGTISASDVGRYVSSPFALYCDHHAPEHERDADSEPSAMQKARGIAHEEEVVEGEIVPVPYETWEEGFRLTIRRMAAGEPTILQGPLISNPLGMIGIPDQLRKVHNSKSVFGNYRYRVVEVKLATNITQAHVIQAAFYNRLLGAIQCLTPKTFTIINGKGEESVEKFASSEPALDRSVRGVRRVIVGDFVPTPEYGKTPPPWRSFGDKLAENDLTSLSQIGGPRRIELKKAGYHTITDIANAREDDLAKLPKMNYYVANRIVPSATARLAGAPIPKRPVHFPKATVEMFLDMESVNEGIGLPFCNYLIGVVVRSESEERYVSFFADTLKEEKRCWRAFRDLLASTGAVALYCWGASAEPVYIRKMARRYRVSAGEQDRILNSLVDLHRLTIDSFAFPTPGEGIKDIAGSLGFKWHNPEADGLLTMFKYMQYLDSGSRDTTLRDEILRYNEDDCRAVMFVKDWLAAQ